MIITLQIEETIRHYVTVLAEEGNDGFGILDMSDREKHDQIEIIKNFSIEDHKANNSEIESEYSDSTLEHWDIKE